MLCAQNLHDYIVVKLSHSLEIIVYSELLSIFLYLVG
jgi:hypothetical protein